MDPLLNHLLLNASGVGWINDLPLERDEKGLGQQDFEPYAAFDPLANKAMAINIGNQVCHSVRDGEKYVYITNGVGLVAFEG
ncbi:hypothetical protein YC2023_046652 [Brassica napus]